MRIDQLREKLSSIHAKVKELNVAFEDLVGTDASRQASPGILGVFAFEGQRKLEEFMHRAQDCYAVRLQSTEEALEQVVDQAAADGKLQVLEGGKG